MSWCTHSGIPAEEEGKALRVPGQPDLHSQILLSVRALLSGEDERGRGGSEF